MDRSDSRLGSFYSNRNNHRKRHKSSNSAECNEDYSNDEGGEIPNGESNCSSLHIEREVSIRFFLETA